MPDSHMPHATAARARSAEPRTELLAGHAKFTTLQAPGPSDALVPVPGDPLMVRVTALEQQLEAARAGQISVDENMSALQQAVAEQHTISETLRNVLCSSDVATLFLDADLRIRLFTPATQALFHIISTDVGRPLEDLRSLATDVTLTEDARMVLQTLERVEREVDTPAGAWLRRILPYRNASHDLQGVVVTFTDITHQRHAAQALEAAKREAEQATAAKSRFLAAASHDLRQPLQAISLLQGLLVNHVKDTPAATLVAKLEDTVASMSRMLNALLDINQIEAGVVRAEVTSFPINSLLDRLRNAFNYDAAANGLKFTVLPCGLRVDSDPVLLKQILRNLVANAIKYTASGRVLLGCRRRGSLLRIEIWDTGVGIPDRELNAIFDEYHQVGNVARARDSGLGLGLSIVRRLGVLLNHRGRVESRPEKGSVFSVEVPISVCRENAISETPVTVPSPPLSQSAPSLLPVHGGTLLVVEDDPGVRDLLTSILHDDGHRANAAPDGPAALTLAASIRPDLVITDYNLPGGMDGLQVVARLRETLGPRLPVIVLTGDITTESLKAIAAHNCRHLSKPVRPKDLARAVRALLPTPSTAKSIGMPPGDGTVEQAARGQTPPVIFIIDDDANIRDIVRSVLEDDGLAVKDFTSAEAFLADFRPGCQGCLLIDAYLPGMGGVELLQYLRLNGNLLPAIMITGSSDVPMVVEAMLAGAADFIEKPIAANDLLASISRALERSRDTRKLAAWQDSAAGHIGNLTPRQHQIMELVLAGHPSKNIAADLGISQRTVENHRASIMRTTETKSLPALARLALAATASSQRKNGTISAQTRVGASYR